MDLLNEADALQHEYLPQRENLEHFISRLPESNFHRRLFNPVKVYPHSQPPPIRERRPIIPTIRQPIPSTSNIRPLRPPYPQTATHSRIRCFQCDSPSHIKWYCNFYRCKSCRKVAPGHSYRECPRNYEDEIPFDDGIRGHFDIEGDDGNLAGEC